MLLFCTYFARTITILQQLSSIYSSCFSPCLTFPNPLRPFAAETNGCSSERLIVVSPLFRCFCARFLLDVLPISGRDRVRQDALVVAQTPLSSSSKRSIAAFRAGRIDPCTSPRSEAHPRCCVSAVPRNRARARPFRPVLAVNYGYRASRSPALT